jgi:hypothetical protein
MTIKTVCVPNPLTTPGDVSLGEMGMLANLNAEPHVFLSATEHYTLVLYRVATYITFNVIDDAAMLAFAFS